MTNNEYTTRKESYQQIEMLEVPQARVVNGGIETFIKRMPMVLNLERYDVVPTEFTDAEFEIVEAKQIEGK